MTLCTVISFQFLHSKSSTDRDGYQTSKARGTTAWTGREKLDCLQWNKQTNNREEKIIVSLHAFYPKIFFFTIQCCVSLSSWFFSHLYVFPAAPATSSVIFFFPSHLLKAIISESNLTHISQIITFLSYVKFLCFKFSSPTYFSSFLKTKLFCLIHLLLWIVFFHILDHILFKI